MSCITLNFEHKGEKLALGGKAPIRVQSMTNTDTRNLEATEKQIDELTEAGCELIRVAVPDMTAAENLKALNDYSQVPLIADIHFDYRLALKALESGFSGLRINPGNIGEKKHVDMLADAAKSRKAVIRIGVNGGSLEKEIFNKYGKACPEALVESALGHVRLLEERNFYDIKISIKSSSVLDSIAAYRLMAQNTQYPLHVGITEAGTLMRGTVRSAVGIGILLFEEIGSTIRVSLTADPVEEVKVAWEILKALGLREHGAEIISCPTCGRTEIDLIGMAKKVEAHLMNCPVPLKVAVMGCVVNGPGEAKDADIGMAGGRGKGIIFRKGEVVKSLPENLLLKVFLEEIDKDIQQYKDNNKG